MLSVRLCCITTASVLLCSQSAQLKCGKNACSYPVYTGGGARESGASSHPAGFQLRGKATDEQRCLWQKHYIFICCTRGGPQDFTQSLNRCWAKHNWHTALLLCVSHSFGFRVRVFPCMCNTETWLLINVVVSKTVLKSHAVPGPKVRAIKAEVFRMTLQPENQWALSGNREQIPSCRGRVI